MEAVSAKVVVLGAQGVGKTSLVTRFVSRTFSSNTSATIGASYSSVVMRAHGSRVNMQVWDTAGHEKFRALAPLYYRNANAAVLVFDLTSPASFVETQTWTRDLLSSVTSSLVLVLLGNKLDLQDQRSVSRADALAFADLIGAVYFEASALTSDGVEAAFEHIGLVLAKEAVEEAKRTGGRMSAARSTVDLSKPPQMDTATRSRCC